MCFLPLLTDDYVLYESFSPKRGVYNDDLHLQEGNPEEGGSRFLRNAGIYLPAYTASHPGRRHVIPNIAYLLFKICLMLFPPVVLL